MKMWAVYNTDGKRLLSTENIMKARGFASVRNLKVESDKGDTKSSVVNIDIKNLIAEKNIMEKIDEQKKAIEKTKEEISEVNKKEAILDQQKKDQEILSKAGIGQTKAFYEEGSELNKLGKENLANSKREWENLPDFNDAINNIITKVENEHRESRIIPRRKLYFDEKGNVKFLGESESYRLEDTKTFLAKIGLFPSFDAMYQVSAPKYRSEFLNAHLHHMSKVNKDFMSKPIQFGIRQTNTTQRSIFRTVSPTYTALESSDALKAFRTIADGNPQAKMLGGYNQHDTSYNVTCLFHANHETIGAGSVFKFGAKLKGNDRGNGAHRFNLVAWRNLCLNLIMIAEEEGKLTRVIHRGDFQKQVDKMEQAIAEGKPVFNEFLSHWGYATQTKLSSIKLFGQKFESVEDATEWLVYNGKINIKQKDDIIIENLLSGYMFEEGDTLSHLINMMTRTAHVSYKGKNKEFLEEFAGKLTREFAYA